jgi:hypothetical protein
LNLKKDILIYHFEGNGHIFLKGEGRRSLCTDWPPRLGNGAGHPASKDHKKTDPIVDRIREALDASPGGLTRDQIRTLFRRHIRSERIDAALEQLTAEGNITSQKSQGKGRPSTLSSATEDEDTTPD